MRYDLIVLGAGAAGLMAAAHLPRRRILLIDHNERPGRKIEISGGGRCNLTNRNLSSADYLGDSVFVDAVLKRFDNLALLDFLKRRGFAPVLRKGDQYFCKESAGELTALLRDAAAHAEFSYGTKILSVRKSGEIFIVETSGGSFEAEKILVATGGLSYASVGASGIGYEIAESFGHTIVPPRPALAGLTLQPPQKWMRGLSGLSLPVEIAVGRRKLSGDLLFAHRGISGPAVLDASLFWNGGRITVDFLPGKKLKAVLRHPKKGIASQLPLPRRFVDTFLEALEIPNIPYGQMDESLKQRLSLLKSYAFAPAGTFGYTKAEVTKGGVSTDEIDPATMQSRLVAGLFFAGEVVDVTGRLGGYNFQWAFSSAYVAAKSV